MLVTGQEVAGAGPGRGRNIAVSGSNLEALTGAKLSWSFEQFKALCNCPTGLLSFRLGLLWD